MASGKAAIQFGLFGIVAGAIGAFVPPAHRAELARRNPPAEPVAQERPKVVHVPADREYDVGEKLLEAYRSTSHPTGQILIATIADPVDSHLDYSFDMDLDALRRGFE